MIFYIDASAIVAIVGREAGSPAVDGVVRQPGVTTMVSDFTIAECSSALARNGRVGRRTEAENERFHRELDEWALVFGEMTEIASADITDATTFIRRPGISLRAPDAIHIAAAQRVGATILTLDRGMARAADLLGVPCINPAEDDAPGDPKD